MVIKKPPICQAGSAEAFVGSAATGREQMDSISFVRFRQEKTLLAGVEQAQGQILNIEYVYQTNTDE